MTDNRRLHVISRLVKIDEHLTATEKIASESLDDPLLIETFQKISAVREPLMNAEQKLQDADRWC
jgi:hypothetical protein